MTWENWDRIYYADENKPEETQSGASMRRYGFGYRYTLAMILNLMMASCICVLVGLGKSSDSRSILSSIFNRNNNYNRAKKASTKMKIL